MTQSVVVVGAGMAGCAAAQRLASVGESVLMLEKRGFLGGRATSFIDREMGCEIDNAQHVLLGCCTNVLDLLAELGTRDLVRWFDRFHYIDPDGRRHDLARGVLPAPLHFGPALLTWGALSLGQRLEVARAFSALMLSSARGFAAWRDRPIIDWLRARRQSEPTIARFWRPVIVSAVNEELEVAATLPSLQVFVEGFLPHRDAASMGVPTVGLEALFAAPTRAYVARQGGATREQMRIDEIITEAGGLMGLRSASGEVIETRRAILALPPEALARIAVSDGRPLLTDDLLDAFRPSPILGLHLWFDRQVMDLPQAALLDSRLEWVFAKEPSEKARTQGAVQRVQGVFSAGRDLARTAQDQIVTRSLEEMARAFPRVREARLLRATVVKENRATMVLDAATDALRPGPLTRIEGLCIAGDWTRSGWPATLEGACRSGRLAAAALRGQDLEAALTADLPRGLLARLLMARCPRRLDVPWEPRR